MRASSPCPVMLLAPYGVPPVTSFMVRMPGAVYGRPTMTMP